MTSTAESHMQAGEEHLRRAERQMHLIDGNRQEAIALAAVAGARFAATEAAAAIDSSRALAAAADAMASEQVVEFVEPPRRRRGTFFG